MNDEELIQTEDVTEDNAGLIAEGEDDTASVPEELQGLSPESIKEAMGEFEPEAEDNADVPTADTNSVKKEEQKQDRVIKKPSQKIPYERFKEVLDKNNDLKVELEALKKEMAAAKNANRQPEQKLIEPARPTNNNGFKVTPEVTARIDEAIKQQAMAMSGLTEDDIESIDYMDDDDTRKIQYNHAMKLAEARVYASIEKARQEQIQNQQRILAYHNRVADSYNNFVNEVKAEPDYEQVVNFAQTEFYNSLSEEDKPIIMDAYIRVERNTASPQDVAVVKRFFTDAKAAYRSKSVPKKETTKNLETKYAKSKAFPRSGQVAGSAGSLGTPSVDALERMLNEVPWDEIPQEYKDMVMQTGIPH